MSVIYEALKKVEGLKETGDLKVGPPQKIRSHFKPYFIYIPAIGMGFLIGSILFNAFTAPKNPVKEPPPAPLQIKADPAPVAPTLALEDTESKKESRPLLILNGIFSSQNEGYALINNLIVKEGDDIEGATVVRISQDSVELKFADSVINLSYQNN